MTRLLVLHSSPRSAAVSVSRWLTRMVVDRFVDADGDTVVSERDLAAEPPDHVRSDFLDAVRTPLAERTAGQRRTADYSDSLVAEVRAADLLIIGAPMYNFGVPSTLKAWIDWVSVPGVTFRYRAEGMVEGLLPGRPAIIVTSRGGDYRPSAIHSGNFADPLVKTALGLLGFERFETVAANWQSLYPEARRDGLAAAEREVARLPIDDLLAFRNAAFAHG